MLYSKVKIGEEEVLFCTAASVTMCYYNIFHEDFMAMMAKEERIADSFTKMAFVMAKMGELGNRKLVSKLTIEDYGDWLDKFSFGDLTQALPEIQEAFMRSTQESATSKKNSEEPIES